MRRKPFSFTSSLHGLNEKEAATKCTSLTTIFLRTPIFGCVAPPMPFRSRIGIVLFLIRMFNQLQSITIHWLPIRPEHTKIKMLLISRREHHNGPTVFERVDDSLPQLLTHTSADMSHKDTRRYLALLKLVCKGRASSLLV